MQDTFSNFDVVINGMGPVGAALACLLGNQGIKVCVLDKSTKIFEAPRAIALDNEALRILQLVGLPEGSFQTIPIPEVNMLSPIFGRFNRITTAGAIDGHPKLVTFFQPELETRLRERLKTLPSVETRLGWELKSFNDNGTSVAAYFWDSSGQTIPVTGRFLVGADGASSTVRHLLGLDFKGRTYAEDWLIVDVMNAPTAINHVEFICDPQRPAPHMPAPGSRQRWEFKLRPGETKEHMEKQTVIRELLKPWDPHGQSKIERIAVYRFHARVADSFSRGSVFLVGDAAHITPPFVGQGLVAGLRDAANLAWKLAAVSKGWSHEKLLETYDAERRPHAKEMINVAKLMGKLVMPRNKLLAFFSHGLVKVIRLVPRFRRFIENAEIKPPHVFAAGALITGNAAGVLRRGGQIPQVILRSGDPARTYSWSDEALNGMLTLIGYGVNPRDCISVHDAQRWADHGGNFLTILPRGQSSAGAFEDYTGELVGIKVPMHHLAAVRPDGALILDAPDSAAQKLVSEALAAIEATQ